MAYDFSAKVAVVTGAAGGLGATYARAYAERGAAVALLDIQAEAVQAVASEIAAWGGRALALACDVAERAAWQAAIGEVVRSFGQVDILVNNAAAGSTERGRALPWYELPEEDFDRAMAVNVRGAFYGACAVAPHFIAQRAGKIINVSSATFWQPSHHIAHYIASKAGIIGLTRALAVEFGDHGVNVNAIAPGLTRTARMLQVYPAEAFARYRVARALGRDEEPADLVGAVMYLSSPASDFVTGQVLLVDGGSSFH